MCGYDVVELVKKVKVHGRNEINRRNLRLSVLPLNLFFFALFSLLFRRQCSNIEQAPKDIYL